MKLRPTTTTTMNLSDNTLGILKNFAGINNSILVKEGNQLRTISVMKNILAEAQIPEDFPRQFGIYDLNQFLNGLSLHTDPNLDFTEESYLTIDKKYLCHLLNRNHYRFTYLKENDALRTIEIENV